MSNDDKIEERKCDSDSSGWNFFLIAVALIIAMLAYLLFHYVLAISIPYTLATIGALAAVAVSAISFLYNSMAHLYLTFQVDKSNQENYRWIMRLHNAGPGVAVKIKLCVKIKDTAEMNLDMGALGPQGALDVDVFSSIPDGSFVEFDYSCGAWGMRKMKYCRQLKHRDLLIVTSFQ